VQRGRFVRQARRVRAGLTCPQCYAAREIARKQYAVCPASRRMTAATPKSTLRAGIN